MSDEDGQAPQTDESEGEAGAPEEPELQAISEDELKEILAEHRKWVQSEGNEGTQADLGGADMQKARLANACLQKANLAHANLQKASLAEADLQGAVLVEASLQESFLSEANLQNAYLRRAKLQQSYLRGANLQEGHLVEADLQGANLWKANLQNAYLRRAKLQKVHLAEADLREAELVGADMRAANLQGANLQEANLQDADLSDVKGLLGEQLAGANVCGANLPVDIKKFDGLKVVEEASKNARKLFLSMLAACAYVWLTIWMTQDLALLLNRASTPLPIIRTEVPIVYFFWAAPFVLAGLYLYLHLYLQRLWEGLADLPAVFPDGKPLDKKAYPWLLTGLVRAHFKLLREERPPFSQLQVVLSVFLVWWVAPLTIYGLWARYIPRHDWVGTGIHLMSIAGVLGFAVVSHRFAVKTLRGESPKKLSPQQTLKTAARQSFYVVPVSLAVLIFLSIVAISGPWRMFRITPIGYRPFVNLAGLDVSEMLEGWTEGDTAHVRGANLNSLNLRFAAFHSAFLAQAELRADLTGANLTEANLTRADLYEANLTRAYLTEANLNEANLSRADLTRADLADAYLTRANMYEADLTGTLLAGADLYEANLTGALLAGTNLYGANLYGAEITSLRRWQELSTMARANLFGVVHPPDGFLRSAIYNGAVCVESDEEWEAIKNGEQEWLRPSVDADLEEYCNVQRTVDQDEGQPSQN